MAFFSSAQKQSSQNTLPEKASLPAPIIRTLEDDLKDVKGGGKGKTEELGNTSVNPFNTQAERQVQPKQGFPKNKISNPFGVTPPADKTGPTLTPTQTPILENGLTSTLPDGVLLSNRSSGRHTPVWVLYSIASAIVLIVISTATWYFFFNSEKVALEPVAPVSVTEKSTETSSDLSVKQSPFSLDKPNYLSLNTETVSPLDIKKTLFETADRIKMAGISVPIEFLVTDQNNNPLAFSRFAFLLDLSLDTDLLALIQEAFSLYAYNDNGNVRLGLALDLKNTEAAALLAKTETDVPYALRALILEPDVTVAKKSVFRSAAYNQFSIRFTNIDSNQNISLDYSLYNNRLFIGMSKNTLRVLLDNYVR